MKQVNEKQTKKLTYFASMLLTGVIGASALHGCSKPTNTNKNDDTTDTKTNVKADTKAQSKTEVTQDQVKANYANVAHAMYADALKTAKTLQTKVDELLANPSETTLNAAKEAYKATRAPYQQSEIMRWDGNITQGKKLDENGGISSVDDWEGQVNAWPLDEGLIDYVAGKGQKTNNTSNVIASKLPLTEENIIKLNGVNDNEANVATGVHAIEFLLWGQDLNGTKAGAGKRPATDYDIKNCSNGHCERRRTYLKLVTDLLVKDLTNMTAEWDATAQKTEGTLAHNFLQSEGGIEYMVGAMRAMATDELASARMGAAFENNDTEEEHDCFSDLSHVAIYNNFQGVKNAFYGQYGAVKGASLADLIRQKSPDTFTKFDASLKSVETKMKKIFDDGEKTPAVRFDQLVGQKAGTGERANAENAFKELISLTIQFNDMKTVLNLKNLVDTDGD